MIMLIKEHSLLCQIRFQEDIYLQNGMQNQPFCDAVNDQDFPICVGLTQVQLEQPGELVANNQGSIIMASNAQSVEIFKSSIDLGFVQGDQIEESAPRPGCDPD